MKPWHNFLEGLQCAAGAEEVHVEAAKPDWSNSLGQGETGNRAGCRSSIS